MAEEKRKAKKISSRLPVPRAESQPVPAGLARLAGLEEVEVKVTVEWGRTQIAVEEALRLGERSLLRVDKLAQEPVDVLINGKLFGRGKLVLVGGKYGVQLTEIIGEAKS
jgi:flagellar motor switch protein FliN/FliY